MKELFHFSLFERRGVLTLLGFVLLLVWIPDYVRDCHRDELEDFTIHLHVLPDEPPQGRTDSSRVNVVGKQEAKVTEKTPYNHITVLDVNQASAADWKKLPGIGPVFSKRIVAFRESLGGFSNLDQIGDTYGLADSVFERIKPHLRLQKLPKQLAVNIADAQTLSKHPYISGRQANVICLFRKNHGPFSDQKAFEVLRVFSEDEHRRLKPYLSFVVETTEQSEGEKKNE